ncbi:hypothetical protein [Streptomyces sp. DH12]|uniref:hypothetical protein n=1 Tax=Streptomyces sp. DH12 TaxID=2857010 RepID=UPI001E446F24|nr:hypothetical protein [Streptomyces sp. DH12]
MTTQTQQVQDGTEAEVPIEAPEPAGPGVIRLCDPAEDRARLGWHRIGGSNAVGRYRADAHLVVDIDEPGGDGKLQVRGQVRGIAHHRVRETGGAPWKRTGTYRAQGWLKLLRRDTNGHFAIVVDEAESFRDNPGPEPVVPVTLSATVDADRLGDYAFQWTFGADGHEGSSLVLGARVHGRRVLFVPPSMQGMEFGTLRDPRSGRHHSTGDSRTTAHHMEAFAQITTRRASATETEVSTEVTVSWDLGFISDPSATDIHITSALERYDTRADRWRTAASHHHTVHKPFGSLNATGGQLTHTVPTSELNLYRYVWGCADASQQTKLHKTVLPIYRRAT